MTDACALTGTKNDPRLADSGAPDGWRFWMQISRIQEEHGQHGFDMKTAVEDIAAKGYSLFTGSQKLLAGRARAPSAPASQEGTPNA
jgi:hypothetical protein